ncbi:hypothetical protein RJ641_023818 [Dillenia turbinata]|uniref:Uncharacterized protein n=1 Tax=Dillenia turbinata TaxID=194707 RepID=A0AAN8UA79_9MAGN
MPLFDPPRQNSANTIRRALNLVVTVKMITGDQLAIAKEKGHCLGMGTNMHPSSVLLGEEKSATISALPVNSLKKLMDLLEFSQETHCGDGVNDALALENADISIAVAYATDATHGALDIDLVSDYEMVSGLQHVTEDDFRMFSSAVCLRVSTISQALIFVTRTRSWSFVEHPDHTSSTKINQMADEAKRRAEIAR